MYTFPKKKERKRKKVNLPDELQLFNISSEITVMVEQVTFLRKIL